MSGHPRLTLAAVEREGTVARSHRYCAAVGCTVVVSMGLAITIARPACAQRQIRIGTSIRGQLGGADFARATRKYYKEFTFSGTYGQAVQIDLRSSAFEPALLLQLAENGVQMYQNTGTGDHDARIIQTLPYTGTYEVWVSTVGPRQRGAFTLDLRPAEEVQSTITMSAAGEITSSSYKTFCGGPCAAFAFRGTAGQTVQVDLSSTDFGASLWLKNIYFMGTIAHDQVSGGTTSARIIQMPSRTETLYIVVATVHPGETGAFALQLRGAELSELWEGTSVTGQLTASDSVGEDGTVYKDFTFEGRAGHTVRIGLVSSDFQPAVCLWQEHGQIIGCDIGAPSYALLITQLPATETYHIVVKAVGHQFGRFTLQLR